MNQDVSGDKNGSEKVVGKVKNGKMEHCIRLKYRTGKVVNERIMCERLGEYFEDLYNVDTEDQFTCNTCDYNYIRRNNYF